VIHAHVVFLPGIGHRPVRLAAARAVLRARGIPVHIIEMDYPHADTFDELVDQLSERLLVWSLREPGVPVYATGVGALVALALRARGSLVGHKIVIQGGALWGLGRRTFPRVVRVAPVARLVASTFRNPRFRERYAEKNFQRLHSPEFVNDFFEGYGDGRRVAKWLRWLRPSLLRKLEKEFAAHPDALEDVEIWWGEKDKITGLDELSRMERAVGQQFPLHVFEDWGHYPMIDAPEAWVTELTNIVECSLQQV
jgi:pimeloyl-ACP methyl ester carboxylesterase